MTFRVKESDISAMVDRLNRNLESYKSKLRLSVVHQYNYINLFSEDHSAGYSYGNTKQELYWQLALTNKILEYIAYERKDKVKAKVND